MSIRLLGKKSSAPNIILAVAIIALIIWLLTWLNEQGYLNIVTGT